MKRVVSLLFVSLFALPLVAGEVTTVILVRHAEKDSAVSPTDPPLTQAGGERAEELARILRDSGITAIFVTPYQRTRDTARPVAALLGLEPQLLQVGKTLAADTAALIREKHAGQTVLVVGHSNSTPELARALGAPDVPNIADPWEFDNIFVVTLRGDQEPAFLRLRYGAVSKE